MFHDLCKICELSKTYFHPYFLYFQDDEVDEGCSSTILLWRPVSSSEISHYNTGLLFLYSFGQHLKQIVF